MTKTRMRRCDIVVVLHRSAKKDAWNCEEAETRATIKRPARYATVSYRKIRPKMWKGRTEGAVRKIEDQWLKKENMERIDRARRKVNKHDAEKNRKA